MREQRPGQSVSPAAIDTDRLAAVQHWRTLIDTQMHFNDMLLRTRSVGISIVIAVFGAAAVSTAQYPDRLINLPGFTVHVAAIVILFGLMLLVSVFVLDYFYYYRMLLAVVRRAEEMEAESRLPGEPIEFSLSSCVSREVSRARASGVLIVFYGIPFGSGLLFLLYLAALGP